jgi:hypothetical protein
MLGLLVEHGYQQSAPESVKSPSKLLSKLRRARKTAWLFLARRLGINPPGDLEFEFWKLSDAIDYARNISRGNHKPWTIQVEILEGRERLRGGRA